MHSCAALNVNLAKLSQPTREKKQKKMFNIVSCHRRLKDPTSDGCRSRISHKPNLILVDNLSTRNLAGKSASKLTLDEASRFHRIASSTAVSAE